MNETTQIEDVDRALLSAMTPKVLKSDGLELKPYNYVRQQAAVMMGLHWTTASRMHDAAVDVWLCTLDDIDVLKLTASPESLAQAKLDAYAWADAQGYNILNFEELMKLHNQITKEIVDSTRAKVKPNGDSEHAEPSKNVGGPRAFLKKERRSRP
jgi:hypothetical protein